MDTARYFAIAASRAAAILGEVERAVARWRQEAARLGFTRGEIEAFAEAFEHDERRAAQRLMT